jgi:hypothetical protein
MTPPTARTWPCRGTTPVVRVRGRSQRRISIAALACYKPGVRSRLIHRPIIHRDHKAGGRRSFARTDYRDLLIDAHQQLGRPIVLVRDNLNLHRDARMRAFADAHDWITTYRRTRRCSTRSRASGPCSAAAARPTPRSPTPNTSCALSVKACARSNTAAT